MDHYDAFTGEKDTGSDGCIPVFHFKQVHNKRESDEKGTPIFESIEYVRIMVPNSRDERIRPVEPGDIERWPQHYEAFQRGEAAPSTGFPLTEWPGVTRTEVEMLKGVGIKTIEQLSGMSENRLPPIPGIRGMIEKARDYEPDKAAALQAKVEELEAQLRAIKKPARKKKAAKKTEAA
jgi:hypothetical protein